MFVAVSHSLKGELMWMYNLPDWKVPVVYNGVSARAFDGWLEDAGQIKAGTGSDPWIPWCSSPGRITYKKGPDLLAQAIPMLLHHHPNARFVFAGDGHMRSHC
ncbi:MAG: glycosyltransferase family 4 protein [Actinobacteria bacterium]|nr:MAG: glycosyltransferase family 4 protein [Actinomycetota bacterium]